MMIRTRHIAASLVLILLTLFAVVNIFRSQGSLSPLRASKERAGHVTHTVLFQFKQHTKSHVVRAACARFLSLKDDCVNPITKASYIRSLKGGSDNSPEGLQGGITHGFVVEFKSIDDRDYYVSKDPAHLKFKKSIEDLVEKAVVVDFFDGVY